MQCETDTITIASRSSPLARTQVQEVLQELQRTYPNISFSCLYTHTIGDIDKTTSLRSLDKTDFFTRELDKMVLDGSCRVAIHSAKDLPDPLPKGLQIIALTKGVDSSDSLVLRQGDTLDSLRSGAIIATSSVRREEAVRSLRADVDFIDVRGTIEERLQRLEDGAADGVVIAEAALMRLGLTHLNRVRLPGPTVPLQGQLAVVCRCGDTEMASVFSCIDCRKKALCVGLQVPQRFQDRDVDLLPLIEIRPRPRSALESIHVLMYTHILFTSKSAVDIFFKNVSQPISPIFIAVGTATAEAIRSFCTCTVWIAEQETAEGVVALLETKDLAGARVLWPHSSLSRPVISEYLQQRGVQCDAVVFYDTYTRTPEVLPDLNKYDEIIFTSPSTIDAFVEVFGSLPKEKHLTCIGPVTYKHLECGDTRMMLRPCL